MSAEQRQADEARHRRDVELRDHRETRATASREWLSENVIRTPLAVMLAAATMLVAGVSLLRLPATEASAPAAIVLTRGDGPDPDVLDDSYFAVGKADLTRDISALAGKIATANDVVVIGYADARGEAPANEKLAEARAVAVKNVLVPYGFHSLRAFGLGERFNSKCERLPKDEQEACFKTDRRVEIWNRRPLGDKPPAERAL